MANEVVKFNNDMNTVALRKFNSTEINLLMSICSRIRDQGLKYVEFDFKYLKKLIKYPYNDMKNFVNTLDSAYNKLLKCKIRIGDDVEWTRFVLFTKYTINVEKQIVTIGVNEEFKYVLNELTSNFTRFELEEFVDFKSTYTKEFYRRMKQFRHTGVWKISIDDFNRLLGISESYKISDIDKRVFQPILSELGEKYNLKIIKRYSKKTGRGRSSVSGFEFHFKKENRRIAEQENLERIKQAGFDIEKIREHKIKEKIQKEEKNRINKVSDFYLYRKVKMYDSFYEQYNYLEILAFNQKNDKLNVKIRNVDDGYVQDFTFDSFKNFENWFRKYAI